MPTSGRNNPWPLFAFLLILIAHSVLPRAVCSGFWRSIARWTDRRTRMFRASHATRPNPPTALARAVRAGFVIAFFVASAPWTVYGQGFVDTGSQAVDGGHPFGLENDWTSDPAAMIQADGALADHGSESSLHDGGPSDFFGGPAGPHPEDEYETPWSLSLKSLWPPTYCLHCIGWLGLRHSETHGRHVGLGAPFVGTSWLNRPYYVGAELGTLWIMRSQDDHVSRDTDVIGGVFVGWDWDHFWGSELRFDWATPELINSAAPDADRTDSLFAWNANFMYYPWGDSKFRPYWRWGLGTTRFDFPTEAGTRRDEWLVTMPIGIGMKYPIRRWLTTRAEFTDQFSIGSDGLPTQHNLSLTFGLECRLGAHPRSYWPWNPSRRIW
jgi:hypothetical protein